MRPRTIGRLTLGMIGVLLMLSGAQVRAEPDPAPDPLGEEVFFEDISSVYAASKYEQPLSDAPSLVTIVTAEEIEQFGYRTLADILDSVRGFYTTDDRNYGYAGIRGFGRPGDYNTRILLMLNGQRLNDNVYDSAVIGHDFVVEVGSIRRVEIVRGPGSSLYGANAFFAVVNVITMDGRDMKGLRTDLEFGSHGGYRPSVSYGDRFQNGLEFFATASVLDMDGARLYYPEFDDPGTNNGITEGTDYEVAGNYAATLSWRDFWFQTAYQSREKGIPTGSYDTVFNDTRNRTIDRTHYINVGIDHTFDNSLSLSSHIEYGRYEYEGDYVYDWADPGDPPDLVVNHDYTLGRWWGAGIQVADNVGRRNRIVGGFDYRGSIDQLQQNYDLASYLNDSRHNDSWGVFVQDELQIHPRLTANLGVRYDHYDSFGGTTNPRLALLFSPVPDATIKLLYGTAFRPPNAYELYYHDDLTLQKPGLDLEPEQIDTYELGVEKQFSNQLRGTASVYYYEITDLIDQFLDPADGLLVFRNLADVNARGVEMELEGKWFAHLNGRISYSIQHAEDGSTGARLSNSPEHLAKLNLLSPLFSGKAFVGVEARFTGNRLSLAGERVGSDVVTNLTVGSRKLIGGLSASASIFNVFDRKYGDVASPEFRQTVILQDGRGFWVRLGYVF